MSDNRQTFQTYKVVAHKAHFVFTHLMAQSIHVVAN